MESLNKSFEERLCDQYIAASCDEGDFTMLSQEDVKEKSLFAVQGFEERSVGIVESLAERGLKVRDVVIAEYGSGHRTNAKYRKRFEAAARSIADGRRHRIRTSNSGHWVADALELTTSNEVILDITGVSNRALFGVLDESARSGRNISIAYCEPEEYWPTQVEWLQLRNHFSSDEDLAEQIDNKPWLFGHEHRCELVDGHEGYDSAGSSRAMVAFLPFKAARLASVLGEEEYSEFLFIAGRPRLDKNAWRLEALRAINANIVGGSTVLEMDTFGYRKALGQLAEILFSEPGLLQSYDVHMASMGSKLQEVACWVLSCILRSVTLVASVPSKYYPSAFSNGIAAKWIFPLLPPGQIVSKAIMSEREFYSAR
jgi:hypothetical protein